MGANDVGGLGKQNYIRTSQSRVRRSGDAQYKKRLRSMQEIENISSLVSVVIPAFNEEGGIAETLESLKKWLPDAEIIVVDDGSFDGTSEIVRGAAVTVLRNEFNRGYGASLKRGMQRASRPYIAWFDADNEHRADDLRDMVVRLHSSNLAAIIGRRKTQGTNTLRIFGKWAIGFVARVLSVRLGPDINCGLRVFRKSAIMPYSHVLPDSFSASVTSTMILVERGYAFDFHTIDLNPRVGTSKVKVAHGFEAMVLVLRVVTLFAPLRIFVRGGLLSFVTGLIYGLAMAIKLGQGVPSAAVILMLAGVIFGMLGLIADQISQIRLNQLSD